MNYSNAVVGGMLGWLKGLSNWLVNLVNVSGSGSMNALTWIGTHWILLVAVLVILGLAIDCTVWLARWRPYWVWFRNRRIVLDDKNRSSLNTADEEGDDAPEIDPNSLFTISEDDPDALTFWQEDVFKVTDLQKKPRRRKKQTARR